jgi:uncharacterized protein YdaU (DUF1376 family)
MPLSRPPYFPFYVNDFCSDGLVEAMTTEEVGAYILLLCKAWLENQPGTLPCDDRVLARWSRLTDERWMACKPSVLSPFKLECDNRYHQKRMKIEHKSMMNRKKERSESGKLGAKKKWHSHRLSHEVAMQEPMAKDGLSSSSSSSSSLNTERGGNGKGETSTGIYEAYPRKVGKPDALRAIQKALVKYPADFLLQKTKEYAAARVGMNEGFTPHPATWFNRERFNDLPGTWADSAQTNGSNHPTPPQDDISRRAGETEKEREQRIWASKL